jgi:hypothetical protein
LAEEVVVEVEVVWVDILVGLGWVDLGIGFLVS